MELPEIRQQVAQHLNEAQLAAAAAVCKAWNSTFTPVLYCKVNWSTSNLNAETKKAQLAFQKHAFFLREMTLDFLDNPKDAAASLDAFTHIESINFQFKIFDDNLYRKNISQFIHQNPGITTVNVTFEHWGNPPTQFLRTLSSCPKLKSFRVRWGSLDQKDIELFLQGTSDRLEKLALEGTEIRPRYIFNPHRAENWRLPEQLPKLEHLSLHVSFPALQQIALIERCPRLKEFAWFPTTDCGTFPVSKFINILATKCPLIIGLCLECCPLLDKDFSVIVDSCQTSISNASFYQTKFGPLSVKSLLARHANSLTLLNLVDCIAVTSAMTQQLLVSCPKLTNFYSTILNARDILGITEGNGEDAEKIHPQPWACTNIQVLEVYIGGLEDKPLHWRRLVYQQIGRLEKLEELDVNPSDRVMRLIPRRFLSHERVTDGLKLQLQFGLDNLGSLKRLNKLIFYKIEQKMEKKDVQWMVDSWPKLKGLHGISILTTKA
ncbi:hypothetical protein BGX27_011459 [Mortierella sp. AM989]|nr:hypothetical protein BGX27_011459 [Mortierella sp. AM989]